MNPLRRSLALLATVSLLAGCATLDVDHSFDPAAQFSAYQTFSSQPVAVVEWDKTNTKILGSNGVALDYAKAILQEKGYRYAENGDADFLVTARAETVSTKQTPPAVDDDTPALSFSWGELRPASQDDFQRESQSKDAVRMAKREATGYDQYYLVIEIVDAPTRHVVWQGWARYHSLDSFKSDSHKAELVSEILARFPN